MKIYIRSTANISAQETFGRQPFLTNRVEYHGNVLKAIEPDYTALIDPKLIRRMSHIIRMGVATALECLKDAGEKYPGAIVTGTAYGCLEETDIFLKKLIGQKEEMLSPTPFIQSTHNTVGAQIALALKCTNYNNTFVHRGFSFESALLDAVMLLEENEAENVLVGSADEISDTGYAVLNKFNLYKRVPVSNLSLFRSGSKGTIAGEGAAFFLLTGKPGENNLAKLDGPAVFYKPADTKAVEERILNFLAAQSITVGDIDLVIFGKNGDVKNDALYDNLKETVFKNKAAVNYKHLCGEYPTSSSFALWLAVNIIRTGTVPAATGYAGGENNKLKKLLIYNNYANIHHSLMLVSAC